MQTFALVNLGCSKNVVDGQRMMFRLRQAGYRQCENPSGARIIIVNTCAFIQQAQTEAIDTILAMARYKTEGRCRTLVVTGCFAQRFRAAAARRMPEVDLWCGVDDWANIFSAIFKTSADISWQRTLTESSRSQYLKIAEGCSHACSYCVIPSVRGIYSSRAPADILAEARWLYRRGVRECILVAQDTSWYGRDIKKSLAGLLKLLLKETSFPWIRLMYLHPAHLDDSLLRLIAAEPRLCSYFDIPVQHCSDEILRAMRRKPGKEALLKLFDRIRSIVPDAVLRTSLITGFPGETGSHFKELLAFCDRVRFDKLGVFPFSPEEGTPAARLKGRPRNATAVQRAETLLERQRAVSAEILRKKIGTTLQVFCEGPSGNKEFPLQGRTYGDAPEVDGALFVRGAPKKPGAFIAARIIDASDYDLFAEADF
ncbi:MAG: 30S ribosomal protein S12 methylthiotransferase RimO [Chitinivibrionales bacterium]|nr:30S ribosomal protein S12 methylthiotransferase RimO [Chitinivibrionales bacterium]